MKIGCSRAAQSAIIFFDFWLKSRKRALKKIFLRISAEFGREHNLCDVSPQTYVIDVSKYSHFDS